jgi:hypothetical protein
MAGWAGAVDDAREKWILERLAQLSPGDGEYRALSAELLYDYARSLGDRAARQKLDGALYLYRELLDEKVAHELRQLEQLLREAPLEPSAPTPGQPPPAAAPAPARKRQEKRYTHLKTCEGLLKEIYPDGIPADETNDQIDGKVEKHARERKLRGWSRDTTMVAAGRKKPKISKGK